MTAALVLACAVLAVLAAAGWATAASNARIARQLRATANDAVLAEAVAQDRLAEAERALEAGRAAAELEAAVAYGRGRASRVSRETTAGGE